MPGLPFRRLALAAFLSAGLWLYVLTIAGPFQVEQANRHNVPRGHVSDMFGPWAGARALILEHRNPYSPEVTEAIQRNTYGRSLDSGNSADPKDEQRLVYPLPMLLLVSPAAPFQFDSLRPIWDVLLLALTVASVPLWMTALGLKTSRSNLCIATVLTLGSWPFVQALQLQQPSLIVCFLLALASALIARGRLIPGGILLVLSVAKPQIAAPLIGFFALWSLLDLRRRWQLLASMTATFLLLLTASELLLPRWWIYWWQNVRAAKAYVQIDPMFITFFGRHVGTVLTLAIVAASVALFVRLGREPDPSRGFAVSLAAAPLAGLFVSPQWLSYSQAVVLPTVLWMCFGASSSNPSWINRCARFIAALAVGWPWLGAWILLVANSTHHLNLERWWWLPLATVVAVPTSVAGAFALMARNEIRGWNVQPRSPSQLSASAGTD